ncbi:hypothetical protein ACIRPQ_03160 [Streptomyces sp. NPDC101213]|uniref:hypothetical protein n=1 Tax=unclassified Streptomyces TaxID=2593676 RepID=UPI0036F70055
MPNRAFVGRGSVLDPPGLMERCAWPAIRRLGGAPGAHTDGVRRAVVKIYHARHPGRPGGVWRIAQEEAAKLDTKGAQSAAPVT